MHHRDDDDQRAHEGEGTRLKLRHRAGEETSEPRRCGGRGQRAGQRQRCSHRQDELPRQARLEVFPPEDADARRDEQERRQQRRNRRVQAVPGIGEPERGREQENHQRATLGAGERRVDRALGDGTVLEARRA